ncbi:uncharacterized protein LOC116202426 isoform X2 [Punica granatum]|uniref:Uncharacterized protein LOC116202426 isoform X2 n=1 Tax=Punica granatum TaxID=22663 RepID=A0A218Y2J5_PUNGR|nr:uncharacterized protein LOC116202426 isoform X2 [Punica granatum]OWM91278.1 hypothetical protein CDL15_Pgr000222 [Punica granatum]
MDGEAVGVTVSAPGRWGTWEELLLGGAVLRHGTRDWEMVASELRSRILCPFDFTPEVCKAKYEDLRHRFSGCSAWFEELRKQRMEELRQALERSESSIGSLQSKLKTLMAKKEESDQVEYDSSRTVSLEPVQKPNQVESFRRDSLKDGLLSSSSFTQETSMNWSAEEVLETKPNISESFDQRRDPRIGMLGDLYLGQVSGCIRKKRGKRKRKDCGREAKEGSVGESEFVGPIDVVAESRESKETSTSDNGSAKCDKVDLGRGLRKEGLDDLMRIFSSVVEHKSARVFLQWLDGQKRGRYKKLIRRHIDLERIKTKLTNHSTTSSMELFRDLLLLANNALVFYAKNTRENKSALLLRHTINRTISRECNKDSTTTEKDSTTTEIISEKTTPKVKSHSSLLNNQKSPPRRGTGRRTRKAGNSRPAPSAGSTAGGKRRTGGTRRGRSGNPGQRSVNTGRGRKRARSD